LPRPPLELRPMRPNERPAMSKSRTATRTAVQKKKMRTWFSLCF
jgi:hypothetical protein